MIIIHNNLISPSGSSLFKKEFYITNSELLEIKIKRKSFLKAEDLVLIIWKVQVG